MRPLVIRHLYEELSTEYRYSRLENVQVHLPNVEVTDTGLLSVAAYLKKDGLRVGYFWPYLRAKDSSGAFLEYLGKLKQKIESTSPLLIGAGPYTNRYLTTLAVFRFIKRFFPETITILGGQHVTFMDTKTLQDSHNVDIIIRGEGEKALSQTAKVLLHEGNLRDVKGITYREKNGKVRRNRSASPLDPADIPVPAYDLLPGWVKVKRLMLNVTISRGCPYNCLFCTEKKFWGVPRARPVEKIAEELILAREKYDISFIRFADDTFTWNQHIVSDVSEFFSKEGLSFDQLQFWTRADQIDEKRLIDLAKMGDNIEVCLGVESASPHVLRVMRKGITFEQCIKAFKKIQRHGAISRAFWIVGHPGSSPKAEERSYRGQQYLMKHRLCMLHETSVFVPYPGSEPFQQPERYGIKFLSHDWSKFCENPHTFPPVLA